MSQYLKPIDGVRTFDGDSEWLPLLDGATYLPALAAELSRAGAGDTVLVTGLEADPDVDLCGRGPDDPDFLPFGRQLAELVDRGVDVRVLLAGRVLASSIPWAGLGPFRANAERVRRMRSLRVDGSEQPPLARRVLLDYSGAPLGSNHQKYVVTDVGGTLSAFVGGIDLVGDRYDAAPHDRLRIDGKRWGWHDAGVRLRGPAALEVATVFAERWTAATALPPKRWFRTPWQRLPLNPSDPVREPPALPQVSPIESSGMTMQVLRSTYRRHQQLFAGLVTALSAARRYIYLEDQYLQEAVGGSSDHELWPHLRAAAGRGVKVILVGSGVRDPEEAGVHLRPINRRLNADLRKKLIDPLADDARPNVVVFRVERCTVHAKLVLIDDRFVSIGSANMFSRSMAGTDSELGVTLETGTDAVRDLRIELWAEHLRTPLTARLRTALADLDLALGIWRTDWLPAGASADTWQRAGRPDDFAPAERVLIPIERKRR